ncbi:UNVERIFIED_CONTAM: Ribulose bisphosphate carboxylase small chain, chloroplastic [Sesamum latifolium]|uniref:Ribulose bisphosphate carboxylase small chain, chloroplastic n=1 Tax=Sesamum latifolium TaxID=2727402 RepID=A0AAW2X7S0_9LAMI
MGKGGCLNSPQGQYNQKRRRFIANGVLSVISSTAVAARASPAQASMVAPFAGLKSAAAFPVTRKSNDITSLASNGGRVQCIKVWPTTGKKKFETLSYLPDLTKSKEIDYLIRSKWIPCIEELEFS